MKERPMSGAMHLIAPFLLALTALVSAQSSSTVVYPTTAAASATAVAGASGYRYVGCYNETTSIAGAGGARAITGGTDSTNNYMTVDICLAFCASSGSVTNQFAGVEYGRECYCGPYLSTLSVIVNSSHCNYACNGNASELCGGSLAISLYNLTSAKTGQAWGLVPSSAAWYGSAAAAALLIAAML